MTEDLIYPNGIDAETDKALPLIPTNRPITSREYKLLLNTERFRDRIAGARLFWRMLEFLVRNQGSDVIPVEAGPDKDTELHRTTWYLDTPGFELQRANVTLRLRDEVGEKKRFKITLKYRMPDRYTAAGCDPTPNPQQVKKPDIKFEEDVIPPFVSKFSYSASFRTDELPRIETIQDAVELFPSLAQHSIPPVTPIQIVNGFRAHEVMHYIGKLKLDKAPTTLEDGAAEVRGQSCAESLVPAGDRGRLPNGDRVRLRLRRRGTGC